MIADNHFNVGRLSRPADIYPIREEWLDDVVELDLFRNGQLSTIKDVCSALSVTARVKLCLQRITQLAIIHPPFTHAPSTAVPFIGVEGKVPVMWFDTLGIYSNNVQT